MMNDIVLAEMVTKKRSGSATTKGSSSKIMSKDVDMDDGTNLALKDLVKRKAAVGKLKADKSISKANKAEGSAENTKEVKGAEAQSAITKNKGEYSMSKKGKPHGHIMLSKGEEVAEEKFLQVNEESVRTPMKRKRGADGEIIQAYLSSSERNLSRFRPRKEVPAFWMVDLAESDNYRIVSKRVKVYWPESRRWFTGRIQAFDRRKKLHSILYEDGDKEDLDLGKERFELEIMPSESFNLRAITKSQKKVAVLGGLKVSAGALTEKATKVGDTENVTETLEAKKKGASKRMAKRSAELNRKDTEGKKGEQSASGMDLSRQPEKIVKVSTDAHLVAKEPDDSSGKQYHNSKTVVEIAQKATGVLEAETDGRGLSFLVKTVRLNDSDGDSGKSGETAKDESTKKGTTNLVKKQARSRRKATSSTAKRRRSKLLNRNVSLKGEKLHTELEDDAHHGEAKMKSMHNDICINEVVEDDNENKETEAVANKVSEDHGAVFQGTTSHLIDLNAENIIGLEDGKHSGEAVDEIAKQKKMEMASKIPVHKAVNMKNPVLAREEKLTSGEINVEMLADVVSGKNDDEMHSHLKVVNEGSCEVHPDLQPTELKSPEGSLGALQGKLDLEKDESDRDMEKLTLVRKQKC